MNQSSTPPHRKFFRFCLSLYFCLAINAMYSQGNSGNGNGSGKPAIGSPLGLNLPFWNLKGNAGDSLSFAGTTNNFPFNIKVNNSLRGTFTNSGLTVFGSCHSTSALIDSICTAWQVMVNDALSVGGDLTVAGDASVSGNIAAGQILIDGTNSSITSSATTISFGGNNLSTSGTVSASNINALENTVDSIGTVTAIHDSILAGHQLQIATHDSVISGIKVQVEGIQASQWKPDTVNAGNIYFDSGKVGIGTSAPSAKLDVFGSARITNDLYVGGELMVSDKFSAKTIVTDTISPNPGSGKIRVLAQMSAEAIRVDTLSVSEKFSAEKSISSDTLVAVRQLDVNHNLSLGSDSGSNESDISSKVNILTIQSSPAESYDVAISAESSSKVGIGTKTPTEKLSVDGNVSVSGNIAVAGNSLLTGNLDVGGNIFTTGSINAVSLGAVSGSLYCNGSTSFKIAYNYLGVVDGCTTTSSDWNLTAKKENDVDHLFQISTPNFAGEIFTLNNKGRAGFGTKNPQAKVEINEPDEFSATTVFKIHRDGFWGSGNIMEITKRAKVVGNPPLTVLVVKDTGNVGIGTSEPMATLDVKGSGLFAGAVGIGTAAPAANLDIRIPANPDKIGMMVKNENDGLFFVPLLGDEGYNKHSVAGDAGIFWDGYQGANQNAGLVIGPWESSINSGLRITHDGLIGIGTKNPGSLLTLFAQGSTDATSSFHIQDKNGSSILFVEDDGKVGIGTPIPQTELDVVGDIQCNNANITGNASFGGNVVFNGNLETSGYIKSGNSIYIEGGTSGGNTDNTIYGTNGEITFSGGTPAAPDKANIKINIGQKKIQPGTPHDDYKLCVDGKIVATTFKVTTNSSWWADHVFEKNYKLPSLLVEVAPFISKNGHLPGVPTQKEILQDGLDLGKMDAILLQKIEELTLYTIEQQKQIEELKKELKKLKIPK